MLLEPGVWLTAPAPGRIRIGAGTFLNRNVMVAAVELVEIGAHCMLANGCFVTDGNHRFDDPDAPVPWQGFTTKGPTRIGDNVWLGANVVVTSGVTIGERAVIGANSVVTTDIPPRTIAAGVARARAARRSPTPRRSDPARYFDSIVLTPNTIAASDGEQASSPTSACAPGGERRDAWRCSPARTAPRITSENAMLTPTPGDQRRLDHLRELPDVDDLRGDATITRSFLRPSS